MLKGIVFETHSTRIEPKFTDYHGDESKLFEFVISTNLQRNHFTSSQLAVVALDIEKIFAAEAEQRMKAGVKAEGDPTRRRFFLR